MILSTSEAQELHTGSWQAQKYILRNHGSPGILLLVRSLVLSDLVSCVVLQLPRLLWLPFIAVRDVIIMKQSDWSVTNMALGIKTE